MQASVCARGPKAIVLPKFKRGRSIQHRPAASLGSCDVDPMVVEAGLRFCSLFAAGVGVALVMDCLNTKQAAAAAASAAAAQSEQLKIDARKAAAFAEAAAALTAIAAEVNPASTLGSPAKDGSA